ncbi:MAG: carboxymuconolactone decarboxylase family protein [Chthoniobacterales bacterium]|nr:carboxymuconolactone decarboxylase family protein [Chthoniobacterales bacterium]
MRPKPRKKHKRSAGSPRLAALPMEKMKKSWAHALARIPGAGLKGKLFPKNVLGTLMHNGEIFGPFLDYWVGCKLHMGLTVREQELIILRMAVLYRCEYVWKHHVPVAREFGVQPAELAAVRSGKFGRVFPPKERGLLLLTDELVEHRTIRAGVWRRWQDALTPAQWIALVSLVSQYVLFALTNNAFAVRIERPLRKIPGL